ncbi:Translation machinery associated TMA7 [Cordyceps fumosorosea ARSEF 2679]|uniref:Translation machinery associated TMA7 n=1 Tax=Cordyceps fumosorosea (strain ARSEF 2679) TaxID=1081104 RepID=A0A167MQB6_CORFA|nr:Translation machinery associated TMA7 [Cordyceps fumosorosea ARSEF 2679]OAA54638.1 Translation machinery associated TMA7 [Cordyceps fumosorosea ARSEF 2679]
MTHTDGKLKPLKAAKKEAKVLDDEDKARIAKQREVERELKDAKNQVAKKKGPLKLSSQGLKKSGKK